MLPDLQPLRPGRTARGEVPSRGNSSTLPSLTPLIPDKSATLSDATSWTIVTAGTSTRRTLWYRKLRTLRIHRSWTKPTSSPSGRLRECQRSHWPFPCEPATVAQKGRSKEKRRSEPSVSKPYVSHTFWMTFVLASNCSGNPNLHPGCKAEM